jgi:hypothetical protein
VLGKLNALLADIKTRLQNSGSLKMEARKKAYRFSGRPFDEGPRYGSDEVQKTGEDFAKPEVQRVLPQKREGWSIPEKRSDPHS